MCISDPHSRQAFSDKAAEHPSGINIILHILQMGNDRLEPSPTPCNGERWSQEEETPGLALKHTLEKLVVLLQTGPAHPQLRRAKQSFNIFFQSFWLLGLIKFYIYSGGTAKLCWRQRMRENEPWLEQAYLIAWYQKATSYSVLGFEELLKFFGRDFAIIVIVIVINQLWTQAQNFPLFLTFPENKPKLQWDPFQFEWICISKGQKWQTESSQLTSSLW